MTNYLHKKQALKKTKNTVIDGAPSTEEMNAVLVLYNEGQNPAVETLARSLTTRFPRHGFGWKVLGTVLHIQDQVDEALLCMQKAAGFLPGDAVGHNNLGMTLKDQGRFTESETSLRQALAINPEYAQAHNNLGVTLKSQGRLTESEASLRQALAIKPDYAEAHSNLGITLNDQGRLADAEISLRQALALNPNLAESHNNLGNTLRNQGRLVEAESSLRQALALRPNFVAACSNLGHTLQNQGRPNEAINMYRQALALNPDYAEAHNNLGVTLYNQGQLAESEISLRQALVLKPDFVDALNNLGNTLKSQDRLTEAETSLRRALVLRPESAGAHSNLGSTLHNQSRPGEAIKSYRQAMAIKADFPVAHDNLLFCLSHDVFVDPQQLYAEHLTFGEKFEASLRAGWQPHNNTKDPERCLQVGFVSGDLCNHALANFLEPVFEFLAKKQTLSIHAYYTHTQEDEVTQRLRCHFAHWHAVASLGDVDLANQIRADGIDILIDLSGHTAKNRLLSFIHKPAPIQVSWLGYLGTTGLQAMDYYLCDNFWIPPGELDWQFTEKPAFLPSAVIFQPSAHAPPVNRLPALANGYITLGSFNRPNKLNASVIALWSMLLRNIPNARMVLGAIPFDSQDGLIQSFAHEGIEGSRLVFFPRSNLPDYLALHHQVDFCLDTFPYGGGATTAHAAWMGVPTLSLAGETPASRFGATEMHHLGLDKFIGTSIEDFVNKGCYWAEHIAELATLRTNMRARFMASSLGQPQLFSDNFEALLRTMWQRWCNDLPVQAIANSDLKVIPLGTSASHADDETGKLLNGNIAIVSATKLSENDFWSTSALGISLQHLLKQDNRLSTSITFENSTSLSKVFNNYIDQAEDDTVLVFIHDDVWIDDVNFSDAILAGLGVFDVIGVAGNRRRLPNQPAWAFVDQQFTWDDKSNLSGRIAHGKRAFGQISDFGAVPAECELLDGVFLAAKKSNLKQNNVQFDTQFDFHFYDMDFCRSARKSGLRLGTWLINLTHQSGGAFGSPRWIENYQRYLDKWENDLQQAINDVLQIALKYQNDGQPEQAENLYLEIIKIQPTHAEANHNLGLLEIKSKSALVALPRLEIAVLEMPENEQFWVSYIKALMQSGPADSVADALELGQKYGLRSETAQTLAADFVAELESRGNEQQIKPTFAAEYSVSKNNPTDMITTLIPAYKYKYISELLLSLTSQTYKQFRVIISDDSPNGEVTALIRSPELRKTLDKINIEVIQGPRKGGMSNIVNLIDYWNGSTPLVHFLFDDDLIYPTFYQTHCLAHSKENVGLSVSYRWYSNENGQPFAASVAPSFISASESCIDLLNAQQLFSSTVPTCYNWLGEFSNAVLSANSVWLLRQSTMQDIPYYGLGDIGLFLQTSCSFNVALIKNYLGIFRQNPQQNSMNFESVAFKCGNIAWIALALAGFKSGNISANQLQQTVDTIKQPILVRYKNSQDMQGFITLINSHPAHTAKFEKKFIGLWNQFLTCDDWSFSQKQKKKIFETILNP